MHLITTKIKFRDIKNKLKDSTQNIEILFDKNGRPVHDNFLISISHSGKYVISIAIPKEIIKNEIDPESIIEKFNNNKYGLIYSSGKSRATYLPYVFPNSTWDNIKKKLIRKSNNDETNSSQNVSFKSWYNWWWSTR